MWVSVAQSSYTHQLILETGRFSFIALHERQSDIALACGTESGFTRDKCALLDLSLHEDNFLYLKGALASTACRVRTSKLVGDHTLFIADLLSGEMETRATVYRQLLLSDIQDL